MYSTLLLPWSDNPAPREDSYRCAGLVRTKGTLFLLPPPERALRDTFNSPPRPKTRMSSGAVALCKHFERGGASSEHGRSHPFWTLPHGSNENKTEMASKLLEAMLKDAVWKNIMLLHHGVAVYEVRNQRGFGMRWTLDIEENVSSLAASEEGKGEDELNDFEKDWRITKTTFRGFLEPILGMDDELECLSGLVNPKAS